MITLLHPSRSRPEKAYQTAKKWIENAGVDVEYILSIDNNDPKYREYWKVTLKDRNNYILHDYNESVVEATNRAAKIATGDILLYLSDDFKCFDNWGLAVLKEFEGESRPLLLKVDDCLQKFTVPVLTIPIMNRQLYERLGYFWHPEYKSMFVDEDLYWTAQKLNAMKMCPHLKFEHHHVANGKAQDDETYRRSSANWNQGKAVYQRRKAEGFPI
jgi:hypothetical protein